MSASRATGHLRSNFLITKMTVHLYNSPPLFSSRDLNLQIYISLFFFGVWERWCCDLFPFVTLFHNVFKAVSYRSVILFEIAFLLLYPLLGSTDSSIGHDICCQTHSEVSPYWTGITAFKGQVSKIFQATKQFVCSAQLWNSAVKKNNIALLFTLFSLADCQIDFSVAVSLSHFSKKSCKTKVVSSCSSDSGKRWRNRSPDLEITQFVCVISSWSCIWHFHRPRF